MDDDKFLTWIKTFKILGIVIGIGFIILGILSYLFFGDDDGYISLGEDGLIGAFIICFSYLFSTHLQRGLEKKQMPINDEEEHDVGL